MPSTRPYASWAGADIQRPLAVVLMGGLVSSTLLTPLVVEFDKTPEDRL
jgi:Cu/Ag efflux pump CusA